MINKCLSKILLLAVIVNLSKQLTGSYLLAVIYMYFYQIPLYLKRHYGFLPCL